LAQSKGSHPQDGDGTLEGSSEQSQKEPNAMPFLSNCPQCDASVSLPQGVDPDATVRCPLCEEEYLLSTALEKAPPELIVISSPAAIVAGESEAGSDFGGGMLAATADATTDEEPAFSFGDAIEQDDDDARDREFGEGEFTEEEGDGFSLEPEVDGPTFSTDAPSSSTTSKPKRKKKGPGIVVQMVGIAGGGAIGLAAGFMILLWGFHVDPIEGLSPNFRHTVLPQAMIPEAMRKGPVKKSADVANKKKDNTSENDAGDRPTEEELSAAYQASRENVEPTTNEGEGGGIDIFGDGTKKADPPEDADPFAVDTKVEPAVEDPFGADPLVDDPLAGDPLIDDPEIDDPIIDDPNPKGPPPADPAPLAISPKDAPSLSSDDLGVALKATVDANALLAESEEDEPRKLVIGAYMAYCALAQHFTYIDEPNSEDAQRVRRLAAAIDLVKSADDGKMSFKRVGTLAKAIMPIAIDRTGGGVLLAGEVTNVTKQDGIFKTRVMLSGTDIEAIVLSATKPGVAAEDRVVVLGSVLADPAKKLKGYTGEEPQVVWARTEGILSAD
jgi:hypothetical protein